MRACLQRRATTTHSPDEEGDRHCCHRQLDRAVGEVPRVLGRKEAHSVRLRVQERSTYETATHCKNPDERVSRAQERPSQEVGEDSGVDRMPKATQHPTDQKGLPQSAHAVFKRAHVVANVFAPREAETDESTQNSPLSGVLQSPASCKDQHECTDTLRGFLNEWSAHD